LAGADPGFQFWGGGGAPPPPGSAPNWGILYYLCQCNNQYFFTPTGINIFLDGFVPTENLRFREVSLTFKVAETAIEEEIKRMCRYEYPTMKKLLGL
jgi:hypothetical protein